VCMCENKFNVDADEAHDGKWRLRVSVCMHVCVCVYLCMLLRVYVCV
jgi:hypothetical protein